jgi:restriction endonuclease-like protein
MQHNFNTRRACYSALWDGFLRSVPQIELNEKGYVAEVSQNLIPGVYLGDFEADVRQGDGNELGAKFRAAHSSAALAVNTFAPFKAKTAALRLPSGSGFASLQFERKCPHGLRRGNSPNLDVLVEGPTSVVAVEAKCTEHLTSHTAEFRPAYNAEIKDGRRQTPWFRAMERFIEDPHAYCWLDAAQLVKHAFGLAHTFRDRPATLLYLFWEPSNSEAYPIFAEHRAEVKRFAASLIGAEPRFASISYPELWTLWDMEPSPDWLSVHVSRLRARYDVAA